MNKIKNKKRSRFLVINSIPSEIYHESSLRSVLPFSSLSAFLSLSVLGIFPGEPLRILVPLFRLAYLDTPCGIYSLHSHTPAELIALFDTISPLDLLPFSTCSVFSVNEVHCLVPSREVLCVLGHCLIDLFPPVHPLSNKFSTALPQSRTRTVYPRATRYPLPPSVHNFYRRSSSSPDVRPLVCCTAPRAQCVHTLSH